RRGSAQPGRGQSVDRTVTGLGALTAAPSRRALGGAVARVLACPRCGGALAAAVAALSCSSCGVEYPPIGDVSCVVPDPGLWRARWAQRTDHYLTAAAR